MSDKRKEIYTGIVSLNEALNSVAMVSKSNKTRVPRTSISWEKYRKIRDWMEPYADNVVIQENEKIGVKGKPIMPSVSELREKFDMTPSAFRRIAKKYDF